MEEVNISGQLNHRRYTANRRQLELEAPSQDLERIEVRAVPPSEDGARVAANVTLYWPSEDQQTGDSLHFEGLNEGEKVMVKPGTYIRLEKRQAGWLRQAWWLLLLFVLTLLIWLAVFGYLYLKA